MDPVQIEDHEPESGDWVQGVVVIVLLAIVIWVSVAARPKTPHAGIATPAGTEVK